MRSDPEDDDAYESDAFELASEYGDAPLHGIEDSDEERVIPGAQHTHVVGRALSNDRAAAVKIQSLYRGRKVRQNCVERSRDEQDRPKDNRSLNEKEAPKNKVAQQWHSALPGTQPMNSGDGKPLGAQCKAPGPNHGSNPDMTRPGSSNRRHGLAARRGSHRITDSRSGHSSSPRRSHGGQSGSPRRSQGECSGSPCHSYRGQSGSPGQSHRRHSDSIRQPHGGQNGSPRRSHGGHCSPRQSHQQPVYAEYTHYGAYEHLVGDGMSRPETFDRVRGLTAQARLQEVMRQEASWRLPETTDRLPEATQSQRGAEFLQQPPEEDVQGCQWASEVSLQDLPLTAGLFDAAGMFGPVDSSSGAGGSISSGRRGSSSSGRRGSSSSGHRVSNSSWCGWRRVSSSSPGGRSSSASEAGVRSGEESSSAAGDGDFGLSNAEGINGQLMPPFSCLAFDGGLEQSDQHWYPALQEPFLPWSAVAAQKSAGQALDPAAGVLDDRPNIGASMSVAGTPSREGGPQLPACMLDLAEDGWLADKALPARDPGWGTGSGNEDLGGEKTQSMDPAMFGETTARAQHFLERVPAVLEATRQLPEPPRAVTVADHVAGSGEWTVQVPAAPRPATQPVASRAGRRLVPVPNTHSLPEADAVGTRIQLQSLGCHSNPTHRDSMAATTSCWLPSCVGAARRRSVSEKRQIPPVSALSARETLSGGGRASASSAPRGDSGGDPPQRHPMRPIVGGRATNACAAASNLSNAPIADADAAHFIPSTQVRRGFDPMFATPRLKCATSKRSLSPPTTQQSSQMLSAKTAGSAGGSMRATVAVYGAAPKSGKNARAVAALYGTSSKAGGPSHQSRGDAAQGKFPMTLRMDGLKANSQWQSPPWRDSLGSLGLVRGVWPWPVAT